MLMDEDNPYASPTTEEPEAKSGPGWRLIGLTLLVKHGTTLPNVDLETGVNDGKMVRVERTQAYRKGNPISSTASIIGLLFILVLLAQFSERLLTVGSLIFFGAVILFSLLNGYREGVGRSGPSRIIIQEYISSATLSKRRWRTGFMIASILVAISAFPASAIATSGRNFAMETPYLVLAIAMAALIALSALRFATRPKLQTTKGVGDFLRIAPIHPNAHRFLMETAEKVQQDSSDR